MKIVVDAMGGDYAPKAVVAGVVDAINELGSHIVLVGDRPQMEAELKQYTYDKSKIEFVHTDEVVAMDEPATTSIRKKKQSSISVGINLLKEPGYDAFISAGNTGAVVAAATVFLGMLPGVERPGIGVLVPTMEGFSFMLDVGANTTPKPDHLLKYALMANVYSREVLGVENPKIGLLNIGEEESKGTDFLKEIHKNMSERLPNNFIGNIEANEIYKGKCDCIISDGFVGNIVLKISEGLIESTLRLMKREIMKSPLAMFGASILKSKLKHVARKGDYSEYGGAPLLGVNGVVIISHGRSNPKAIKNAIRVACSEVEHQVIPHMAKEVGTP